MDKKIISIATKVRSNVKKWIIGNDECDPEDLWGACAIASYSLTKSLKSHGYNADFICAVSQIEGHCFVECDGNVIDITSTQFDKSLPGVYIVDKEYYYNTEIPRFFKYSRDEYNSEVYCGFLKNFHALKEVSSWHDQRPIKYKKEISSFIKSLRT